MTNPHCADCAQITGGCLRHRTPATEDVVWCKHGAAPPFMCEYPECGSEPHPTQPTEDVGRCADMADSGRPDHARPRGECSRCTTPSGAEREGGTPPLFQKFPSIARYGRDIVITEKIDGTNAQVFVSEDGVVMAGSRKRWIAPGDDNFGFAAWVQENADALRELGPGKHYGEWWGEGIQRGYDVKGRAFSLFNTGRWNPENVPECCNVVPILYEGDNLPGAMEQALQNLLDHGSAAAPGYMNPEGAILYHTAGGFYLKKTFGKEDASGKGREPIPERP